MFPKTILIVDDEAQICFCVSLALKMKGYKTIVATDGESALKIIQEQHESAEPISLMICDIQMPKMTGEELLNKLNELKIKIPTLVITGVGEKEMVVRLMRKGCRDFVDKPFDPAEVESRVALILAEDNQSAIQQRRMETMARLGMRTGQIAHDINNILGGAIGFTELAMDDVGKESQTATYLTKAAKAATRAADLCKKSQDFKNG